MICIKKRMLGDRFLENRCLEEFFFNWDSLHAKVKSHYEAQRYKKKKKIKSKQKELFRKNLKVKGVY